MTKILIVDSDTTVGAKVCQELARVRSNWSVSHTGSAEQALALLESGVGRMAFDVVISEARLNHVSSADFLEDVRQFEERIIRLTLTSNADAETEMGNARANQRFLLQPVEASHLANAIDRSLRLRDTMHEPGLKKFMSNVSSVPAVPAIYDEMMAELSSPHSSLMKVGDIVESDTGLTLTVLKVVNSAFYGINKRVESVGQAVTLLGVHLIKNITLTTKVFARFKGCTLSATRLTELNNEAMRIGALANQFARYARLPRSMVDHCQISGMMANVGELIAAGNQGNATSNINWKPETLGASILHGWHMPDSVVEAVALQYESPPRNIDIMTPLIILHSIRYLQSHFSNTSDSNQESACRQYLSGFVSDDIIDKWLDAYRAIEELTAHPSSNAA